MMVFLFLLFTDFNKTTVIAHIAKGEQILVVYDTTNENGNYYLSSGILQSNGSVDILMNHCIRCTPAGNAVYDFSSQILYYPISNMLIPNNMKTKTQLTPVVPDPTFDSILSSIYNSEKQSILMVVSYEFLCNTFYELWSMDTASYNTVELLPFPFNSTQANSLLIVSPFLDSSQQILFVRWAFHWSEQYISVINLLNPLNYTTVLLPQCNDSEQNYFYSNLHYDPMTDTLLGVGNDFTNNIVLVRISISSNKCGVSQLTPSLNGFPPSLSTFDSDAQRLYLVGQNISTYTNMIVTIDTKGGTVLESSLFPNNVNSFFVLD